jgi:hypothetical protein
MADGRAQPTARPGRCRKSRLSDTVEQRLKGARGVLEVDLSPGHRWRRTRHGDRLIQIVVLEAGVRLEEWLHLRYQLRLKRAKASMPSLDVCKVRPDVLRS